MYINCPICDKILRIYHVVDYSIKVSCYDHFEYFCIYDYAFECVKIAPDYEIFHEIYYNRGSQNSIIRTEIYHNRSLLMKKNFYFLDFKDKDIVNKLKKYLMLK